MTAGPSTPAEYFRAVEPSRRRTLRALREIVRAALPRARETMQYRMPTYEIGAPICAIAAQKRYFALYLCGSSALEKRRSEFSHLDVGRGCIRFRDLADLPRAPVRALLREAAAEISPSAPAPVRAGRHARGRGRGGARS